MVLAEPRNLAEDGVFARVEQHGSAAWHAAPNSGIFIARIVEHRHECFCGWIVPVLLYKGPAFRRQPFDIGNPRCIEGCAGQRRLRVESSMRPAQVDQSCDEIDKRSIGTGPVDPGKRIVLGVGIVVATLRAAQFIAHAEHRRAPRGEEGYEQGAHSARSPCQNPGFFCWAFGAAIPRDIIVGSVAIVLAIGLIALGFEGNEIGEGETVMRGDEIYRSRKWPVARPKNIRRSGKPCREGPDGARIATPKLPEAVARVVVPLAPGRWKGTELVTAKARIPWFGDMDQILNAMDPERLPRAADDLDRSPIRAGLARSRDRNGSHRLRRG